MFEKIQGVVLNTIRYSDKHNIVHIYTRQRGLMAFAVPQGKTAGARQRNALLMPLSLIDCEARIMPGRDLSTLRELRRNAPLSQVYADPDFWKDYNIIEPTVGLEQAVGRLKVTGN